MITRRTSRLLELHAAWKDGHLLAPGGVWDQPNAYLEAMRLIDRIIAEARDE